jgi:GRF zinc finger
LIVGCVAVLEVASGAKTSFDALGRILSSDDSVVLALACASIARFCDQYQAAPLHDSESDPFPRQMVVSYRCDGCKLCPIEDTRFTYEARGVDLCVNCYTEADRYASLKSYSSNASVLIAGKPVGKLQCSEMKLMEAVAAKGETLQRQQLFDEFLEHLFSHLMGLATTSVGVSDPSLVSLLLAICHQSSDDEKAARFAKVLSSGLSQAMRTGPRGSTVAVSYIKALATLAVWDDGAAYCISGADKGIDVQGVSIVESPKCHGHGLRCSCRMATHRPNVGRRFFCCSKEAKAQCNFFRWEDDPVESQPHYNAAAAEIVWTEMQPILDDLCKWISDDDAQHAEGSQATNLYDSEQLETLAGVVCSRHRLRDVRPEDFVSLRAPAFRLHSSPGTGDVGGALLRLLALVASPKGNAAVTWSPFLCHMISSRGGSMPESSSLAAKRALLLMCGSRSRYIAVRAHFSFSLNRDRLALEAGDLVLSACAVKERARQCSSDWKRDAGQDVAGLHAGDLLGTEDLISEDVSTASRLEEVRKILTEVGAVAKKRPDHWSAFCGFAALPDTRFVPVPESLLQVLKMPPVVFLFALLPLLRGDAQLRAFQLVDLALSTAGTMQQKKGGGSMKDGAPMGPDAPSSVEFTLDPARILQLTIPQAVTFVGRFGCCGGTSDLRRLACSITWELFAHTDSSVQSELFGRLVSVALSPHRTTDKSSLELFRVSSARPLTPLLICSSRGTPFTHSTVRPPASAEPSFRSCVRAC